MNRDLRNGRIVLYMNRENIGETLQVGPIFVYLEHCAFFFL